MTQMNNAEKVQTQYADDKNLSIRMRLHADYSTNKKGLFPWLFENYKFSENFRILELGAGNGGQWENRISTLPENCSLILSDYSEGMVKVLWEKYSSHPNFIAQKVDIQSIPFPDECFDVVIANHMLYHVPDLNLALSEVRRVLKPNGIFYSSTNGNGGMRTFLQNTFRRFDTETDLFNGTLAFTLENGCEILSQHFENVQRIDYEDSLHITNTQDLINWLKSTITLSARITEAKIDELYGYFEDIRINQGAIDIPKEAGLFISAKQAR